VEVSQTKTALSKRTGRARTVCELFSRIPVATRSQGTHFRLLNLSKLTPWSIEKKTGHRLHSG